MEEDESQEAEQTPLGRLFKVRDLRELLTADLPPLEPIIEPKILWRGSKLLLTAPKKSGKSAIVQQMALGLAGYCPLFEPLTTPKKNRVLLVQFEMHEQIVKERAEATGIVPDSGDVFVCSLPPLKLDVDSIFDLFKQFVGEIKPDVLILDPLYNIHNQDENDAGEMQLVFDRLDDLIKTHNLALILVHHHRKESAGGNDNSSPESRARGTSKLQDWPDTLVTIESKSRPDCRILHFICRRNPDMEKITMQFDPDTWMYEVINSNSEVEDYIMAKLPIERKQLFSDMWDDLDLEEKACRAAVERLYRAGKLIKDQDPQTRKTTFRVP